MKHNVAVYDTGRELGSYSYGRRNDGFTFASFMIGGIAGITGLIMTMAGMFDPVAPFSVALIGLFLTTITLAHFMMFVTHRNFMLNKTGTRAMDAIYTLPSQDRKKYKFTKAELNGLSDREVSDLVNAINNYRRANRTTSGGVSALTAHLVDFNNTQRMIEGN